MDRPYRVLNLGAGVQSTTILLMSCRGELPRLDCAIFADTGWEPASVYEHLEWLIEESMRHGIPVHKIGRGNIKRDALKSQSRGRTDNGEAAGEKRWASMPFRVMNPDGSKGMIRRQCTKEYKIEPIVRFIRSHILGLKKGERAPKGHLVDQWYGISQDEVGRSKRSDTKWIQFVYPLLSWPIEMLDKPWHRWMCEEWLKKNYPARAVGKSACVGCPFHSNSEWRQIKDKNLDEFNDAVNFDRAMRNPVGMRGEVFVHQSGVPLNVVDLRSDPEKGQGLLWADECDGVCNC